MAEDEVYDKIGNYLGQQRKRSEMMCKTRKLDNKTRGLMASRKKHNLITVQGLIKHLQFSYV